MLHIYAYCKRMFHVFHTYVASVLSGCCIYFAMATNMFSWCFRRMLQVFHLDVAKIDLSVAHVAVGLICNSHLLQLLGPPTGTGHEVRAGHGVSIGHGAARAST